MDLDVCGSRRISQLEPASRPSPLSWLPPGSTVLEFQQRMPSPSSRTTAAGVTVRYPPRIFVTMPSSIILRWMGLSPCIHRAHVDSHGVYVCFACCVSWSVNPPVGLILYSDDSAAHISEETTNAARAAPIAILVGVAGTISLGWLLLIAASFATASVLGILSSTLPLPFGQVLLNNLGKEGMLAVWSLIIVVQVREFRVWETPVDVSITDLFT
jgi:hypothetical protein